MTASIASKSVANSIRNLTADEEQKMQHVANFSRYRLQIADTLGEMKGAVMKVGQIASQYKDIFPQKSPKRLLSYNAKPLPCLLLRSNSKSKKS
jgi:predicted unusual protein kinase regulating ubiquinone biosynthesis (AarF/ABC1/UbiB family)